ncbi:hypothetical protein P3H15_49310 [Rhodococcus sp. T2V]|uniref:hypothetical protein n=1 Tax=Rhodococcus sp. T2V TaxID=3034164 RepID=UPI0023E34A0B|nr:hypothetical protein [Rhodococcus sp. T2V]MDF3312931.1 hypothetical protein [Rhodococcus sp. T2V]
MTSDSAGAKSHVFGQSSFAESAIASGRSVVKLPEDLPLEYAGPSALLNAVATRADTIIAVAINDGRNVLGEEVPRLALNRLEGRPSHAFGRSPAEVRRLGAYVDMFRLEFE